MIKFYIQNIISFIKISFSFIKLTFLQWKRWKIIIRIYYLYILYILIIFILASYSLNFAILAHVHIMYFAEIFILFVKNLLNSWSFVWFQKNVKNSKKKVKDKWENWWKQACCWDLFLEFFDWFEEKRWKKDNEMNLWKKFFYKKCFYKWHLILKVFLSHFIFLTQKKLYVS